MVLTEEVAEEHFTIDSVWRNFGDQRLHSTTVFFLGEMRKISREINERMRIKGKLVFARKNFASPVSRS